MTEQIVESADEVVDNVFLMNEASRIALEKAEGNPLIHTDIYMNIMARLQPLLSEGLLDEAHNFLKEADKPDNTLLENSVPPIDCSL